MSRAIDSPFRTPGVLALLGLELLLLCQAQLGPIGDRRSRRALLGCHGVGNSPQQAFPIRLRHRRGHDERCPSDVARVSRPHAVILHLLAAWTFKGTRRGHVRAFCCELHGDGRGDCWVAIESCAPNLGRAAWRQADSLSARLKPNKLWLH